MIVYTCPKCGSDLQDIVLTSYPPQHKKYCSNCGWSHTEKEEICRIPYVPVTSSFVIPTACKGCSNHPSNGGSGICHCTLGNITEY